jgi:glycosyltransferase involved in cell wall biosynthesis
MIQNLPGTAFIIFSSGAFGGAEKRFTNLFLHLQKIYSGKFHFIINPLMHKHIKRIFTDVSEGNIHVIDNESGEKYIKPEPAGELPIQYNDNIADPIEVDENTSIIRKYYWYYKNRNKQKKLFEQIEDIREKENITVLIGIFAGGIPLMFYKENNLTDIKIIFSDMDSWFSDVLSDTKKLWYRKYYSFNYILENADKVDFLSPYIAEGVKKLGVNIPAERISVAPCSFIDYSKCLIGAKNSIEIAFASRLEPDKNPMLYLEAALEILKEFPSVKFHLLGEGSLVNEINKFILDNNLSENINFTFHKNPPEIFKETLIFVSLQTGTNYPSQSVLEAMACGNAIVASNTGDTKLFVNNSNGILVELNLNSVVSAIKKLIADVSEAKMLGLQAAKFAMDNHTIDKVSEYYLELINRVNGKGKNE